MNLMFSSIVENLGFSWETIVLLVIIGACIIFFAKGFQFGLILTMIISAGVFVAFYLSELDYTYILVIFFLCFVLLSLSLYSLSRVKTGGYI